MKILYGVNGVGNGHVTRSRIMANELKLAGHEVTYLFSGKARDRFFDMDMFGQDVHFKKGLTFTIRDGKVDILKTVINSDITTLLRDIDAIDLTVYDLVISDFEPIVSWAARIQDKPCIGIGHQYSFDYDIPKEKTNFILNSFMKWYAPVTKGIGLHWHHFDSPIFPPIVEPLLPMTTIPNTIVVYLAFESPQRTIELLTNFPEYTFFVYGFDPSIPTTKHVVLKPPSKDGFLDDLKQCDGLICNSGFELISEALMLGKRILAKPLSGQMEQHSNKLALQQLMYSYTCDILTVDELKEFLYNSFNSKKIVWPNVASHIVNWLPHYDTEELSLNIWDNIV